MTLMIPSTGQWAENHLSIDSNIDAWMSWQTSISSPVAWGVANRAVYLPIRVSRPVVVRKLAYPNGSSGAGNIDIGLYDEQGTRLVSTGSVAKSTGVNALEVRDVTDTKIQAGLHYLALNNSTTTDTFYSLSLAAPNAAAYGVRTEQLGSVTLPATASWAVDQALAFFPWICALPGTELT